MGRLLIVVISLAAVLVVVDVMAVEIRTYRFMGDAPSFSFGCGECGAPPYTTRATLEGTFRVALDFESGTGELLALDARLVNPEGLLFVGGERKWLPFGVEREFLGEAYIDHFSRLRPPLTGILGRAESHPLRPDASSIQFLNASSAVDYHIPDIPEFAPGMLVLTNTGGILSPDGMFYYTTATYRIGMRGDDAIFSYFVPIIDAVQEIRSARATLVDMVMQNEPIVPQAVRAAALPEATVPEPSGLALVAFCLAMGSGRRCR